MPKAKLKRGFYIHTQSWYAAANPLGAVVEEIMLTSYKGKEFAVRWSYVGHDITPRLEVFDDAWQLLADWPDLIAALAALDNKCIQPKEFCDMLLSLGFVDETKREKS